MRRTQTESLYTTAPDLGAFSFAPRLPLPCSTEIAEQALTYAINTEQRVIAERALATLLALNRKKLWRLLHVLVFQNIGVADRGLVWSVSALCLDPMFRIAKGGDTRVSHWIISRMLEATKDQSVSALAYIARFHPNAGAARKGFHSVDRIGQIALVRDRAQSFLTRIVAVREIARHSKSKPAKASGTDLSKIFREIGAEEELIWVSLVSARKSKDHRKAMLPLLGASLNRHPLHSIIKHAMQEPGKCVEGVPLVALTLQTEQGCEAIRNMIAVRSVVSAYLDLHTPEKRWALALDRALWEIERRQALRSLRWRLCDEIETLVTEATLFQLRIDRPVWDDLCEMIRAELPHLNEIRHDILSAHIKQRRQIEARYRGDDR